MYHSRKDVSNIMTKIYNIGLDIGTESVGWAVVDDVTNKIVKKGNKYLWGVRLFEEAEQAAGRRMSRSTRRRYDRRRKRIKLLQREFKEEIDKVDVNFFKKLQETKYHNDDEQNKTIEISKDEMEKVKAYNKRFPTVYHLRDYLTKSEQKEDIRLVYLAIHHIIKYRGNFLQAGKDFKVENLRVKDKLEETFNNLYQLSDVLNFEKELIDYDKLEKALVCNYAADMEKEVTDVLGAVFDSSFVKEFIKMIKGNEFKVDVVLGIEDVESLKLKFKDSSYDDSYDNVVAYTGKLMEVMDGYKELYDMLFLKKLFRDKENATISSSMLDKFTEAKEDLDFLKKLFRTTIDRKTSERENLYKNYKAMFKNVNGEKKPCIYEQYMSGSMTYEEFKKEINKSLGIIFSYDVKDELRYLYESKFKERIDNCSFMPRINSTDNGRFPYQLNKQELLKIIEKQGKYYPFLMETVKDEIGADTYKLVKLLEFRIPYYVGPLNNTTDRKDVINKNAWLVKNEGTENCEITPYNFHEIINKEETAERFIKRMISHCTYLTKEYAIPADSILYSEFKVRNELKQIKLDGKRISVELQNFIIDVLFKKESRVVTEKIFKNFISNSTNFSMYSNPVITGYSANKKFANTMKSYVDFFGVEGFFKDTPYNVDDAEQIIEWCTIFEDKSILKSKILKSYPNLSDSVVDRIVRKKYSGWSNLSKKLLTGIYYEEPASHQKKSILDLMIETEYNFMQIITKKTYRFQEKIDKENAFEKKKKIDYGVVEELATSPATKRGIYQALKIVEELVHYLGCPPKNIMIEMARSDEVKKRKDNKKEYLTKIYKACKTDIENYAKLFSELNGQEKIDSKRLFLYFIQEGKSLYSGKPLDITRLNEYEIDHIIPRTLIKDDSYDNLALVFRDENQKKAAAFVLPEEYRTYPRKAWWEKLKKIGLISAKKYNNLIRDRYSEEDIEGFINRQLVETRQITKHVANILKIYYENSKIIYLKAELSSNYRSKYELYKFRDINDLHHAHDAYLAAMLGKYKECFLPNVDFGKLRELNKQWYEEGKKDYFKYGYVINSMELESENKETGEIFDKNLYSKLIENTLYRNDIIVTKKTEIRNSGNGSGLYNQTIYKKGVGYIPLKDNMPPELYGGYKSINPAYACMVKYSNKKKMSQRIIGMPIYIDIQSKNNPEKKFDYIRKLLSLNTEDTVEIVRDKIPFYSIFDWNGQICALVGASDKVEVCNAKQFFFSKKELKLWKKILYKIFKSGETDFNDAEAKEIDDILNYILDKMEKEYKLYQNLIPELKQCISGRELTIEEKITVIKELFNLLKFNSKNADLKSTLGLSKYYGKKNDRMIDHVKLSSSSPAGTRRKQNEF